MKKQIFHKMMYDLKGDIRLLLFYVEVVCFFTFRSFDLITTLNYVLPEIVSLFCEQCSFVA